MIDLNPDYSSFTLLPDISETSWFFSDEDEIKSKLDELEKDMKLLEKDMINTADEVSE